MINFINSFKLSLTYIFKDKINFLLAVLPVILGILLYYFLGAWLYGTVVSDGKDLIKDYISSETLGTAIYYILSVIITFISFFVVNWTFVLVVSIIASPFSDLLSERIERQLSNKKPMGLGDTFSSILKNLFKIIINEVKKISFIIIITLLGFTFSFIPFLVPVSVAIAAILVSIEFLDYNWSRHDLTVGNCLTDIRKNIFSYLLAGFIFMFFMTVPILNLFIIPFGVTYYTLLWCNKNNI